MSICLNFGDVRVYAPTLWQALDWVQRMWRGRSYLKDLTAVGDMCHTHAFGHWVCQCRYVVLSCPWGPRGHGQAHLRRMEGICCGGPVSELSFGLMD